MLLIIDGQAFERKLEWVADRVILSAAAYDGLPASGHCIMPDYMGSVVCFDYQMVWGNLKYDPASLKSYWKPRNEHPVENHLMRSRRWKPKRRIKIWWDGVALDGFRQRSLQFSADLNSVLTDIVEYDKVKYEKDLEITMRLIEMDKAKINGVEVNIESYSPLLVTSRVELPAESRFDYHGQSRPCMLGLRDSEMTIYGTLLLYEVVFQ